jgi:hypothetical protein
MDEELVRVEFRVPVWVHVDVEHGEIVSVHVDDVSVEGPVDVTAYSGAPVEPGPCGAGLSSSRQATRPGPAGRLASTTHDLRARLIAGRLYGTATRPNSSRHGGRDLTSQRP